MDRLLFAIFGFHLLVPITTLLRGDIRNKRIVLRLETADDLPPATGDRVQLQPVVLNLLLNAVEAMNGVDDRPRQLLVGIERGFPTLRFLSPSGRLHSYYQGIVYGTREANQNGTSHSSTTFEAE